MNDLAHVQKIPFCKFPRECPIKKYSANTWKKLAIILICKLKLKALVICTKSD